LAVLDVRLEFKRYGNRYFLAGVWVPGYRGRLFPSSIEREIAMSGSPLTPALVALVK
jgi:hypothetical protein